MKQQAMIVSVEGKPLRIRWDKKRSVYTAPAGEVGRLCAGLPADLPVETDQGLFVTWCIEGRIGTLAIDVDGEWYLKVLIGEDAELVRLT